MTLQRVLAAATLTAATFCASAQSIKPGLWEINNRMQTGSGQMEQSMAQMQQQMASMPPEQRKMMQDMMAKQGVSMGAGGPGGMSLKVCMTREMVERNDIPGTAEATANTSLRHARATPCKCRLPAPTRRRAAKARSPS